MIKFSIIIPVYNVAPYLRECLDSVLSQTYGEWEAICVDDGSTDGSGKILDEYAARDKRFLVIHQENAGVSAARNRGLEFAVAEWVVFFDADDVWSSELLSVCSSAIHSCDTVDAVLINWFPVNHGKKFIFPAVPDINYAEHLVDCSTDWYENYLNCGICNIVFKRVKLKGLLFPPLVIGEDLVFRNRYYSRVTHLVDTNLKLYAYRLRDGSAIHSPKTYVKVRSELYHKLAILSIFESSEKKYPRSLVAGIAVSLTFHFSAFFFSLPVSEQKKIWADWKSAMEIVVQKKLLRGIRKTMVRAVIKLDSVLWARLLLWVPYVARSSVLRFRIKNTL